MGSFAPPSWGKVFCSLDAIATLPFFNPVFVAKSISIRHTSIICTVKNKIVQSSFIFVLFHSVAPSGAGLYPPQTHVFNRFTSFLSWPLGLQFGLYLPRFFIVFLLEQLKLCAFLLNSFIRYLNVFGFKLTTEPLAPQSLTGYGGRPGTHKGVKDYPIALNNLFFCYLI